MTPKMQEKIIWHKILLSSFIPPSLDKNLKKVLEKLFYYVMHISSVFGILSRFITDLKCFFFYGNRIIGSRRMGEGGFGLHGIYK